MSNKNSIKYAYIIFLLICVIYYLLADIFNWDFQNWNRIVCGATIASYFFSGAGSKQSICQITSKVIDSLKESTKDMLKIKKDMVEHPEKNKDNLFDIENVEKIIDENNKYIDKQEIDNEKHRKQAFALNVIGFLSFFCILTFKGVYQLFEHSQELYTLIAFIVILFTDAYEEHFFENYGWMLNRNNKEDNEND